MVSELYAAREPPEVFLLMAEEGFKSQEWRQKLRREAYVDNPAMTIYLEGVKSFSL